MTQGRLITLEGGEGTGKSTQARRLAARLAAEGINAVVTREPGGSPFAERLRAVVLDPATPPHAPLAEALLFYAARSDHLAAVIAPALEAGTWVVCDRFSDSTRVYQGLVGGLAPETIDTLERLVVGDRAPDLTILLDLDPAVGLARASQRRNATVKARAAAGPADAYEGRGLAFHERLRAGFLELARREPGRIATLDAGQPVEAIAAAVRETVARRLGGA
jgi:dTMP kinase